MSILLPAAFLIILYIGGKELRGKEKRLYISLSIVSVLLAFAAGTAAESDHVGASLSGVISIFMR